MCSKKILVSLLTVGLIALTTVLTASTTRAEPRGIVHEWGTFTTVHTSDGRQLSGLHLDEEPLPGFVQNVAPVTSGPGMLFSKMGQYQAQFVNVKMETPVIYFYSEDAYEAEVKVDFKTGLLSQYFPSAEFKSPYLEKIQKDKKPIATKKLDFTRKPTSSLKWKVKVMHPWTEKKYLSESYEFDHLETWKKARVPDANVLNVNGVQENFLFYRGLANFKVPVSISMEDDQVVFTSDQGHDIPHVFVYENLHYGIPRILWSGDVKAGETVKVAMPGNPNHTLPPGMNLDEVFGVFQKELVKAGLFPQEAYAMLNTWKSSYFEKPGLRVFWIVPRSYTDEMLPLKISPEPKLLNRVLVGRAELLTPVFEQHLTAAYGKDKLQSFYRDRYVEAYRERAGELHKLAQKEKPEPAKKAELAKVR